MLKAVILSIFALFAVMVEVCGQDRFVLDVKTDFAREVAAEEVGDKRPAAAAKTVSGKKVARGPAGMHIKTYNSRVIAAVHREAARHRIDPLLVFSLIEQESGGKLRVVSPAGARGVMQLMPGTAARFGVRDSFDPDQAVRAGVEYLVWLLDRYNGNVAKALAGYNAGEGSVDAFSTGRTLVLKTGKVINRRGIKRDIPPYRETENYVERIAAHYRRLRKSTPVKN